MCGRPVLEPSVALAPCRTRGTKRRRIAPSETARPRSAEFKRTEDVVRDNRWWPPCIDGQRTETEHVPLKDVASDSDLLPTSIRAAGRVRGVVATNRSSWVAASIRRRRTRWNTSRNSWMFRAIPLTKITPTCAAIRSSMRPRFQTHLCDRSQASSGLRGPSSPRTTAPLALSQYESSRSSSGSIARWPRRRSSAATVVLPEPGLPVTRNAIPTD